MTVAEDGADEGELAVEPVETEPATAWPLIDLSPTEEITRVPAERVARYRGARRRGRGYPKGAIFVGALILAVTVVVAVQAVSGSGHGKSMAGQPFQRPLGTHPSVGVYSPNAPSTGASASGSANSVPSTRRSPASSPSPASAGPPSSAASQPSNPNASPSPQVRTGAIVGINGKCVEAAGGRTVQLDDCNRSAAQTWSLPSDGTVRALGKCLDVRGGGTANRTPVQLFQCNGTGAQQWRQRDDGTWLNPQSGRCLDAENGSWANGTGLIIWDCHATVNQRWQLG